MTAWGGASHHVVLATPTGRTSANTTTMSMGCVSSSVRINWYQRASCGSMREQLLRSSVHPTTAIGKVAFHKMP